MRDVDSTETVTHLSLCAGYGGIDLGLRRAVAHVRTIGYVEVEAFACAILVAKMEEGRWDPAPIWTDIKTFGWECCRGVDIVSGGYPCQPFSQAGKRLGNKDPRHLWPHIRKGLGIVKPRWAFFENVEGHVTKGLFDVLCDLEGMGYRATWGLFSAEECGASHRRKRVFILAHRVGTGLEGGNGYGELSEGVQCDAAGRGGEVGHAELYGILDEGGEQCREEEQSVAGESGSRVLADAGCGASGEGEQQAELRAAGAVESSGGSWVRGGEGEVAQGQERLEEGWPTRPGFVQRWWEPPRVIEKPGFSDYESVEKIRQAQSEMGGDVDGSSGGMGYAELCVSYDSRADELRLLGNGVVPDTAELAWKVLSKEIVEATIGD